MTFGEVYLNGQSCQVAQASPVVGFISQKIDLPSATRADELLGLFALLRGIDSSCIGQNVGITLRIFNAVPLTHWCDVRVGFSQMIE